MRSILVARTLQVKSRDADNSYCGRRQSSLLSDASFGRCVHEPAGVSAPPRRRPRLPLCDGITLRVDRQRRAHGYRTLGRDLLRRCPDPARRQRRRLDHIVVGPDQSLEHDDRVAVGIERDLRTAGILPHGRHQHRRLPTPARRPHRREHAVASTSWIFGDGQSANGAVTSHTYMSPGKYTVGLSRVDTLGNASTVGATIAIAAAPAQPPATTPIATTAPSPRAPQLTHVSETHKTWQEGTRHATIAAKPKRQPPVGTRFGFRVNQATRVTFVFTQLVAGRLISHKCQKQTKTNRKHAHCRLTTTPGTLAYSTQSGQHSLSFQGRLSGSRHLPVGAYTLRITATNPTTHRASNTQLLRFTIVKPS
jgi:hypothetical protein